MLDSYENLIGRKKEIKYIEEYYNSPKNEFVAVYGKKDLLRHIC